MFSVVEEGSVGRGWLGDVIRWCEVGVVFLDLMDDSF